MSWDAYVSNNLMCPVDEKGNTLHSGAILGHTGGVWAKSAEFPDVSTEDVLALADAFGNSPGSVTLAGIKFIAYESDEKFIRGRAVGEHSALGIVAQKTLQTVIVGLHKEDVVKAPVARTIVSALSDYMESINY